ncbi:MAG: HAD family phosphatase, partial [Oscillospiraceae bacterium]|nr:HAD family phosphatase [Oscillospiraceae bacterium]
IMGVKEKDCTVFDDSIASCRSAKDAGMHTVGVYDDFFNLYWEEMQQLCERTIRSFCDLL